MYLKSIEVQGFKSFAHKIMFEFHNGITAIVGPNGSGKSNVADAVRWVLGEQRIKQLRGGTMQDVIFAGTENRKALSYATVAITLDNSDHQLPIEFEEVTITRKLYRSGESEYLINGSACRLKDINELFYDTGIGKEGYSIIGQGQVDKILSGKPEERRELLDEAAGIVKFKRRKHTSLKKLESEQQNLLRVKDILAELERQYKPLEEQSETAREYLRKKESLKVYDINMFLLETQRQRDIISEIDEKIEIAETQMQETNDKYVLMKEDYASVEDEMDMIESLIDASKQQLNETTLLKQRLQNQIELLKEQIHSVHLSDEHYKQRETNISEGIRERNQTLETIQAQQKSIQEELESKQKNETKAKQALEEAHTKVETLSQSIDEKQTQIRELLGTRTSTSAKVQHYSTMMDQLRVKKAEINQRLIHIASEEKERAEQYTKLEKELEQIAKEVQTQQEKQQDAKSAITSIQTEINEKNTALNGAMQLYHREKSRLDSLTNLTERYDGYGNSIRRVMELKETHTGLLGVVADIIKVDKKYEIAVETALGGSIQNIVTSDENTAKEMIAYLKKNKYGRATFLPISSVNGKQSTIQADVLKETGVIGVASTLINIDKKFEGIGNQLLGRTLIVNHIDTGIALSRKYRQSLRIVTLEGELINPGGAMSGGAFRNASNLLGRRREIEELDKQVQNLKLSMVEAEKELEILKEKRMKSYALVEEVKEQLQQAYMEQNTLKISAEQVLLQQKNIEDSSRMLKEESTKIEEETVKILEEQESIGGELKSSEELEKRIILEIEKASEELSAEKEKENVASSEAELVHVDVVQLEQKHNFAIENTSRIEDEVKALEVELSEINTSKTHSNKEVVEKEEKITELQLKVDDSKELFEEIDIEITKHETEKETLQKKNKSLIEKRELLSKSIAELDKEIYRLNARREDSVEASEKQIEYMWEEYEITYGHAQELRDETLTDLSQMKRDIRSLKTQIRELGSVNVNAIEEFKELSERYDFLKTQHDDLIEAEQTLIQIIDELDTSMRKQFKENFEQISKEFDKVFKELFGGGKGTLQLAEDEDILEAGIVIIAQPPGKKLQNMMQLSGGEKALTAISLLFAIQNLKPSPFCLLDEIEAALDDSNVVRFAKYLDKLAKRTQFIVITHRRGTMAESDRLYGITMQEKGVSALVSVDLLEGELDES